jgi:hypothetical protein
LPVERIIIKPNEFRTRASNGDTTFWSGNQYLKTDTNGQFKAGGFQRAPAIAGYNTITDRTEYGGYYVDGWIGGNMATVGYSRSGYLPYAPGNDVFTLYSGSPPVMMSPGAFVSDYLSYSFNGTPNAGTFRIIGDVRGIPNTDGSGGVRPIGAFFKLANFTPIGAGTYVFDVTGSNYYQASNGVLYTGTMPKFWYTLKFMYTKNPVNLELAVTP